MSEEIQKLLPFSCKIEADQKCIKISTHVYSDTDKGAVGDAVVMFLHAKETLEKQGFKVAPLV